MRAFSTAFVSIAAALLCSQANASPTVPSVAIEKRQKAQIGTAILQIFREILKGTKLAFPEAVNAWEYDKNPNMCAIYMETTNGANCYASVSCNDGVKEYNVGKAGWNVCFQGGRQFFTDPRIGDFSITFSTRDGEGEGLTGPVLQVADIGNWLNIPVKDLASDRFDYWDCKKHNGVGCEKGPYICTYWEGDPFVGRTRKWYCGVPKRGMNFEGLDSNKPTNERGYAPGWCGIHVTQYQKPDPSKDQYSLAAKIIDANQNEIGNSGGKQMGPTLVLTTKLPMTFTINSRAIDADPLDLGYDGVRWDSNDNTGHSCSVGAYDNGKREMDCGFKCN